MVRRKENPPHCAFQEISKISHRQPTPPHTKREAKVLGERVLRIDSYLNFQKNRTKSWSKGFPKNCCLDRVRVPEFVPSPDRFLLSLSFSSNDKKILNIKIKGKDANGRPSILRIEEIVIPPEFRLMASDVSLETRKVIFSLGKHLKYRDFIIIT